MSGIEGYPTSVRLQNNVQDKVKKEFATLQPIGSNRHALDSTMITCYYLSTGNNPEAGSSDKILNLTAHGAKKGDIIRITSSANGIEEFEVAVLKAIDADSMELAAVLSAAFDTADTFDILRPIMQRADSTGAQVTTNGPLKINVDGTETTVNKDTTTPANTVAIPVEIVSASGIEINVDTAEIGVQLNHDGANPDNVQIGDGVEIMAINASNEAQVRDDDANTTLTTISGLDFATQTTLAAVLADTASLDAKDFATQTTLATRASEATLAALSAKFNSLGQKASASSAPVVLSTEQEAILSAIVTAIGVTNAKDFATQTTLAAVLADTTSLDGKDYATQTTLAAVLADTASLDAKTPALGQAAAAGSVPVVLANNAAVTLDYLDVVDQIDGTPLLSVTSSNIPSSAGSPLEVVASLAADVKKIKVVEDVGEFIGLYTGAAASEVLKCIIPNAYAGGEIEVDLAAGTRISLRHMKASAIATDTYIGINFLG